ncbi:MAG: tetratricopeptide repeat protein [Chitinophagaceae bacterium]
MVKKQQFILVISALLFFALLFFFGKTVPDKKINAVPVSAKTNDSSAIITTNNLLSKAKEKLSAPQLLRITQLENSVVRGDVKNQQIHVYHQLAKFWGDSMNNQILGAFYIGEAAKLENSEKNLNFAAQLLLGDLLAEDNAGMQNWLATNAKSLFERSLQINPKNDSAKIGIGACYMFGNISDNPMEGILTIRNIAEKNPDNLYAQMMLGLGGIKSGQYDKAIERFLIVVKKQPNNLEAIFHLAETYDRMNDKINAIKWYKIADSLIEIPEAKKEIEERIKALQ